MATQLITIENVEDVAKLPDEVPNDKHKIVNDCQFLENSIEDTLSVNEEPHCQIELHGKSKHSEAGMGYEALEETFSFPLCLITKNIHNIPVGQEDKDMVNNCHPCYPLVDQDVGQIFAGVHCGHVDKNLRVGSVRHGVKDADVAIENCTYSNVAKDNNMKNI